MRSSQSFPKSSERILKNVKKLHLFFVYWKYENKYYHIFKDIEIILLINTGVLWSIARPDYN